MVALRILRIVAAYALAIGVTLAVLPLLFALISALSPNPGVWIIGALSPVFLISAPFLFPFAFVLAVVVTIGPALVAIVLSEFLSLRAVWWSGLSGALLAAIAYWQLSPRMLFGLTRTGAIELGVFALAGLAGGIVYWGLAGRTAGVWR